MFQSTLAEQATINDGSLLSQKVDTLTQAERFTPAGYRVSTILRMTLTLLGLTAVAVKPKKPLSIVVSFPGVYYLSSFFLFNIIFYNTNGLMKNKGANIKKITQKEVN